MLAALSRSRGRCVRSWAALGAYVHPMLAVLGRLGPAVGGPGRDQAGKWPQPERERDP